ncbi:MAG: hypothetical protein ABEJ28_06180 [Salinigranum sp.]
MELEEGMRRKIVVSVVAVLAFIALIVGIGETFYGNGSLGTSGGLALVVSIVLFVLVMGAIGVWLAR